MVNDLALFIFRRDLRLEDNTALINAMKNSKSVIPCFIFDKRQIENNEYRSDFLVNFMINSIKELKKEIEAKGGNLYLFYGTSEQIIEKLIKSLEIDSVYLNKDYTPFSKKRDEKIKEICEKNKISYNDFDDSLINFPGSVLKDDGKPYTIFTPFYRKAQQIEVKSPIKNSYNNFFNEKIDLEENKKIFEKVLPIIPKNSLLNGGRNEALKLINDLDEIKDYKNDRNYPSKKSTSLLSAHNKFGTVSIREVYLAFVSKFGEDCTLISELYWRDFFTHIIYFFPYAIGGSFKKKYDEIIWQNDKEKFKAWCEGKTGFPIVDAGMRELNNTGYMHNRVRMIVASFLVKDLHIDWKLGEKYFAQKLIDYDISVNNGNWQWAASTGCDAQPYFRIFNPWSQQEKFDNDCVYIKKWVPELKDLSNKEIHNLHKERPYKKIDYPEPIVDHKEESNISKSIYSNI